MLSLDTAAHNGLYVSEAPVVTNIVRPTVYVRYGKRIFDLTVASLTFIFILSWMIPLIGGLVLLTSRGPVLFRQKRSGQYGKEFWCLKFRTMYYSPATDFAQCAKNDPRVTPIGRFLRRTNLDEMPQFLNVLLGEMSVVGPRPHAVEHDERYWFSMPTYYVRYQVKPGITGLAQVRGARGETNVLAKMKHRVQYDTLYVKRQSLLLDVKMCIMTVMGMINGDVNAW